MSKMENNGAPAPTSYGLPARIDGMDAAQLRATLTEDSTRGAMERLAALDTLSAMLWLYCRLPRALGRQAHIDAVIERLARNTGADVADDLTERGPAPANEHEQEK